MKSESGISYDNAAVASCPKHLLQFAVDQRYDDYTSVDHAVWRFIMRQNIFFLKEYAHKVYFQGLLNTGISFDRIPRIQEMNDILAKVSLGAVAVDGFIPPGNYHGISGLQGAGHRVRHAPDPSHRIHARAGYCSRGRWSRADHRRSRILGIFAALRRSRRESDVVEKDFELYQAIRHLSILKERPNADPKELDEATKLVEHRQKTLGEPSEMALLSRLHWWTVEYGLIGTLENPKIYGAGLLSSIGEWVSCLESAVKKIPYSIDAQTCAFDITTKQPQLFVCTDFQHLRGVLEEFASTMAFKVGGLEGVNKAIECQNVATCEYSSGVQVGGVFTEVITDENDSPIYLRTTGKTALAFRDKELEDHGVDYHKDGFGSPVGKWKQTSASPELLTNDQLHALGIVEGRKAKIEFVSGVDVSGKVESILRRDGKLLLITFSNCTAKYGDRVLFNPDWGMYDMAVGERISSVFNGAADKDAYNQVALVPKERTIKVPSDAKRKRLENLYAQVRTIRESKAGYERLGEIWETQQAEHPEDWLLSMEIFEILDATDQQRELKTKIEKFLNEKKAKTKDLSTLISWGFRLVDYHKKPEYQAALQASPK